MSKFVRFWLMPLLGAAQLAVAGGTYRAPSFSLPLAFEPGTEPGRFVAHGRNYQFQVSRDEIDLLLVSQTNNALATAQRNPASRISRLDQAMLRRANDVAAGSVRIVSMKFVGANSEAQLAGRAPMQGKVNYLVGNRPEAWRTGLPCFSSVGIAKLYSGIDLVCYGSQRSLEYDLDLAPGADLSQVSLRIEGADQVSIDTTGELVLSIGSEQLKQPVPAVYQMAGSQRHFLQGNYYLKDARTVGFEVANYDRTKPLVVDPTLNYSSYFGGNGDDIAWSAKVDAAGNTYVAGQTLSIQYPFSLPGGGYQTTNIGSTINGSAFIAKFDPTLTNLLYFTYLGGYGDNAALDLELDGAGHAYVTGYTDATNFPIFNAVQPTIRGYVTPAHAYASDAFVAELNSTGSDLIFSTYYGGNDLDSALGIALDSSTNIYITGFTYSHDFPVVNPLPGQGTIHGSNDVFVVKLSPMGSNVIYATYLGGADFDVGQGI
ncbi:MAG TPA: SBBP repeat-containing protein, partial [Terriglobales bacterium]|nr:SBBP repeat-containing protein [Terriglobales bacterium]